jgi:hypothetical protein
MELVNATPFPAGQNLGVLSEAERLATVALKVTGRLDGAFLQPVEPDLAIPVFLEPAAIGGIQFPVDVHYGRRAVDLFVIGTAHAPGGRAVTRLPVVITSGEFQHAVDVIGDRLWQRVGSELQVSEPRPFVSMSLGWERCYGGKARLDGLEVPFAANPFGRGYYLDEAAAVNGPLPNVERPDQPIRNWRDQPTPACLVCPPGSSLGFDRRFDIVDSVVVRPTRLLFQAAAPGLAVPWDRLGPALSLRGFSAAGEIRVPLPVRGSGPRVRARVGARESTMPMHLAAVLVFVDQRIVAITFACSFRYAPDGGDAGIAEIGWDRAGPFRLAGSAPPGNRISREVTDSTRIPAPKPESVSSAVASTASLPVAPPAAPPPGTARSTPSPTVEFFQAQPEGRPRLLFALSRVYALSPEGAVVLAQEQPPLPADYDFYDDAPAGVIPTLKAVPEAVYRSGTDVVVQGAAWSANGHAVTVLDAAVRVGPHTHVVRVCGRRFCEMAGDRIVFTAPEAFERMPLRYENAYGGRDSAAEATFEVPAPGGRRRRLAEFFAERDFTPFVYLRNRSGKGYVVGRDPEAIAGRELPNLEHPDDPLTPDRLVCPDPYAWLGQPVPAGVDFLDPFSFPRLAMLGMTPLNVSEGDRIPEVALGLVPPDAIRPSILRLAPSGLGQAIHPDGGRAASLGLRLPYLRGDEPFELHRLHPERPVLRFVLPPERPRVLVKLGATLAEFEPRIYSVRIEPTAGLLRVIWGGDVPLERPLLPDALPALEHRLEWNGQARS